MSEHFDSSYNIPVELNELLVKFTIAVLRESPSNLNLFAKQYFSKDLNMENDEDMGAEFNKMMLSKYKSKGRRSSVQVERIDPAGIEITFYEKSEGEMKRLLGALSKVQDQLFLYKRLNKSQQSNVQSAMFEHKCKAGDIIIKQGDQGDNFYVVESGKFEVLKSVNKAPPVLVHSYDNNGYFGELALLHNDKRSATVKAVTDGCLWALDQKAFRGIILTSNYKEFSKKVDFLHSIKLLEALSDDEIAKLADAVETVSYKKGEAVITEGEKPDGMYFIEEGEVEVKCTQSNGTEVLIKVLGAGEYFGELALLERKNRAASIYVSSDKFFGAKLDLNGFERLLGSCQDIIARNAAAYKGERINLGLKE